MKRRGGYAAPCQKVGDFLNDRISAGFGAVRPTYPLGTAFCPLHKVLPPYVTEALKAGIADMDRRLKGFAAPDALLTGDGNAHLFSRARRARARRETASPSATSIRRGKWDTRAES